ncbi:MAG: phosphoribosylanthranilate isomerase [Pararhizobium sp.]
MTRMPDIKICGLTTPEAVAAALSGGATHIGFIFFAKSPRNITAAAARILAEPARGRAKIVAVTVDADDGELDAITGTLAPDMLQLHGHETPERVQAVKARYRLPVVKAFPIREARDLDAISAYRGVADRLLFDAKPPKDAALPGGNGLSFDWSLLGALDGTVDYMLSGGLTKENIADALAITGARGVDVSSGVESAPGVKDVAMIAAFFEAARQARPSRAGEDQGAET